MIIRSKFESNSTDKKKLHLANSRSTTFKINLPKSKNHQTESKQPTTNHLINKPRQNSQQKENPKFPSLGKQNEYKRKSISFQKKQLYPEQKAKAGNIISLLRGSNRQNTLPSLSLVDKNCYQKLKLDENSNILNNGFSIVNLLKSTANTAQSNKLFSDSFEEITYFQFEKEKLSPQNSFKRKDIAIRKSYHSQHEQNNQSNQKYGVTYSNQIYQGQKFTESNKFKFKQANILTLQSCIFKVVIKPFNSKDSTSVGIQTIQQERQLINYLRYKRKKNEFENELEKAFETLDWVQGDRAIYEERVSKFLGFDRTKPSNEREARIFNLRAEIVKLEKSVESIILQKYRSFEKYVKEFQKIELSFAKQNQELLKSIRKYDEDITAGLKPRQKDRLKLSLTKLEKVFKTHLVQSEKKLFRHVLKGKELNEESVQAISVFQEYVNSIKEQKVLLKNCFGYIKKLPEMCYGLLGDQVPNLTLKKDTDEIEMPKCMQCYNYEWKLHAIIEKNQLMQSIFKVTEELFK